MSRLNWAVFLAAIFGLVGAVSHESSPSRVEGAVNEIDGTAALAPAEGVHQFTKTTYATTSNTVSVKLQDLPVGKVIQLGQTKFVKVGADQYQAVNLCPTGSTYQAAYKGCVVKTTDFAYTGGEQTFTAPADGYYVLEVWGAQGGPSFTWSSRTASSGNGGYSTGIVSLSNGEKLYVGVGQQGKTDGVASYNGGALGRTYSDGLRGGGGGGATHIAKGNSRGELKQYSSNQSEVLIVAGGGGGYSSWAYVCDYANGSSGGGYQGGNGGTSTCVSHTDYTTGGTQTGPGVRVVSNESYGENGSFGVGGRGGVTGSDDAHKASNGGGGGGWYGGAGGSIGNGWHMWAASGGSGYIGNSSLLSLTNYQKHMYCYNCGTNQTNVNYATTVGTCANSAAIMDCSKTGHGAARITQLSVHLGI